MLPNANVFIVRMVNNGSSGAQFDGCHGWHGTSKNRSYVKKEIAWSHREISMNLGPATLKE